MSDLIAWTPELRARIYPSRKHPNPAHWKAWFEDVGYPIDPTKARKAAAYYWAEKRSHTRVKAGMKNNPAAWRPVVEAALAHAKAPNKPRPLDVELEVATVTLELCPVFAAVPYWVSAGGLPFALRALIRCHEVTSSQLQHGYGDHGLWMVDTRDYSIDRPKDNCGAWESLRALLSEAIEPVYDECHGIADEARLRHAGGKPDQSALAMLLPFAFPDEKAWAKAGASAAIGLAKQAKRAGTGGLARFVSVASVDDAVELLTVTINDAVNGDDLVTALAMHGAAGGVKILEAALATAPNNEVRDEWCQILLAVRTADAMKAFERLAKRDKGKKTFQSYAKQHRALVVAKAATKPGKRR
jgi:hypothetical protein